MTRLLPVILVAVIGCSSHPPSPPAAAPPTPSSSEHVLRTYKVPTGQDKSLERLLRGISYPVQVVSKDGAQTQFVQLDPHITGDGYLVLSAPLGIHDGVRELVAQLQNAPAARGQTSIETTCWLVLGWPSKDLVIAPELAEAADGIKGVAELGPMKFELLDKVQVTAIDGDEAMASGHAIEWIRETATVDGDRIGLQLRLKATGSEDPTEIETTVTVKPGQFAVLGQAGYVPLKPTLAAQAAGQGARATLFYLVRSRTLP